MTPRTLYRRIAVAEVVTWALLLLGMVLKYVTRTTDLGVRVFGLVHGVVFIAFCLVTVLLWVTQRWTVREGLLGLLSAVPPFLTLWWERRLEARGRLGGGWRLGPGGEAPTTVPERVVALLLARPLGRGRRRRPRGAGADRARPRGRPAGPDLLTSSLPPAGPSPRPPWSRHAAPSGAAYGGPGQRAAEGADGRGRDPGR